MNNAVFWKTMKNVRKQRDKYLVTTEPIKNYLVSETDYHAMRIFSDNLLANENKNNVNTHEILRMLRIHMKQYTNC